VRSSFGELNAAWRAMPHGWRVAAITPGFVLALLISGGRPDDFGSLLGYLAILVPCLAVTMFTACAIWLAEHRDTRD
jgi:hypothetical protein